jgi:hypothetical protein
MREPELLKSVLAAWNANASALTYLPGGLHEFTADEDNVPAAAQRWATVRVTEDGGSPVRQTNGGPIRSHTVLIEAFIADGDGMTAGATLMHTLGTIPVTVLSTYRSLDNGGRVIDFWPAAAPQGGQTDQTRQAKGIVKLAIAWRVQSRWDY